MGAAITRLSTRANLWPWILLAPLAGYLTIFFLVPLADVAWMSVTEPQRTIANYVKIFTGALYQRVFINTFLTALLVTVCCLVVGFVVAYLMARSSPRGAMLILLLVT